MKFLIDEDVPVKLIEALSAMGHDCLRVKPSSSDREIANQSKKEERILVTLDKDFSNIATYPPSEFNIVRIQIHPPYVEALIEAFEKLLKSVPLDSFKGLIILEKSGHIRITP